MLRHRDPCASDSTSVWQSFADGCFRTIAIGLVAATLLQCCGCHSILKLPESWLTRSSETEAARETPAADSTDQAQLRSTLTQGGASSSDGGDAHSAAARSEDAEVESAAVSQATYEQSAADSDEPIKTPPPALEMSFGDAIGMALSNNGVIRVMTFVPSEVSAGVDTEKAAFDPELTGGGQWVAVDQQARSAVEALGTGLTRYEATTFAGANGNPDQLQLQKTWETGTRTRIGYGTSYNWNPTSGQFLLVNPAWNSGLNVGVEQPLWQGAGRRFNQLGILIARSRVDKSSSELRARIHQTLFETSQKYWTYYREIQYQTLLESSVEQARTIHRRETLRLKTGSGTAVDVAQAREGLESLLADLSESQLRLERSMGELKQILSLPPDDSRNIVLLDRPVRERIEPSLEAGISSAFQLRAELQAQQMELRTSQLSLERAQGLLKPSVSVNASYSFSGLGNNMSSSLSQLQGLDNGNWGLGLNFQQRLGRRAAHAEYSRAETALRRTRVHLNELRKSIEAEVRLSHTELKLAHEVLTRQSERLNASREQYRVAERMYETGQVDLDRLIRSQRQLIQAVRAEQDALVTYSLAVSKWYYVTGTLTSTSETELAESTTTDPVSVGLKLK